MSIQDEIKKKNKELEELRREKKAQNEQREINKNHTIKLACSCGREQSLDEYWCITPKDRSVKIGMSWYDSSINVECKCGKKIIGKNWCNG